ncbi:MAG: DUF951 domain-containing protein [Bacilli bacterium]|nr:DUF951 domain-containing protein [Bacilli bacterium]
METNNFELHDIVEMKKAHPCTTRCKQFEIVMLGADVKIKCLGCGNVIMLSRFNFSKAVKKNITKNI